MSTATATRSARGRAFGGGGSFGSVRGTPACCSTRAAAAGIGEIGGSDGGVDGALGRGGVDGALGRGVGAFAPRAGNVVAAIDGREKLVGAAGFAVVAGVAGAAGVASTAGVADVADIAGAGGVVGTDACGACSASSAEDGFPSAWIFVV